MESQRKSWTTDTKLVPRQSPQSPSNSERKFNQIIFGNLWTSETYLSLVDINNVDSTLIIDVSQPELLRRKISLTFLCWFYERVIDNIHIYILFTLGIKINGWLNREWVQGTALYKYERNCFFSLFCSPQCPILTWHKSTFLFQYKIDKNSIELCNF